MDYYEMFAPVAKLKEARRMDWPKWDLVIKAELEALKKVEN